MKNNVIILLAEDDQGHADLIRRNLNRAGIVNEIKHFKDGQEILDFLFKRSKIENRVSGNSYILLLDIRMPKVDGTEVLKQIKEDKELKKIPVIMITTTDDPREIDKCHGLGCSSYVTKPIEYESFVNAVRQLGMYLSIVEIPKINGHK